MLNRMAPLKFIMSESLIINKNKQDYLGSVGIKPSNNATLWCIPDELTYITCIYNEVQM